MESVRRLPSKAQKEDRRSGHGRSHEKVIWRRLPGKKAGM